MHPNGMRSPRHDTEGTGIWYHRAVHKPAAPSSRIRAQSVSRRDVLKVCKFALAPALFGLGTLAESVDAPRAGATSVRLIDFAKQRISPELIKSASYDGVVNYVSESRPGANFQAKPITREYADELRAADLHIVSNYQYGKPGGSAPSDFTRGRSGGVQDAQTALRLHSAAGGTASAPIFFSVDEDIDTHTWDTAAVEWFRGINSVLGVERIGIYGHSRACAWAVRDGVIGRAPALLISRLVSWVDDLWCRAIGAG
ncbi:DUF1906 domain-containing protein, partial [Mycobacterium ulcerans]|nr:DUF1906 domain-containing protein [Mycobacterium ulcerans]MEB3925550.1 DUF1906 domain-containing protein [Mycobacterium ulcerans]MEB3937957.1 DUF1906 domain-containing protein [Mycobacterium ulcerans]MEB4012826.1 DUF1906 domain-containing protein [Mycobacterium ulcerans]MEB4025219.1 DUF1906 domain-containing protein [Mycobacterium ulcerans]